MGDSSNWKIGKMKRDAFFLCFVTDCDGKKHRIFFLEGKGLVKIGRSW